MRSDEFRAILIHAFKNACLKTEQKYENKVE